MLSSRACSTWVQYQRCWNKFSVWCSRLDLSPLPSSPDTVLSYLNQVRLDSLSFHVVVMHMAAISAFHEKEGFYSSPCKHKSISLFIKGCQRLHGRPSAPKAAMTQPILKKFIRCCLGNSLHSSSSLVSLATIGEL